VPLLIITVRRIRLSGKVRAIVPVAQSHFDFAWFYTVSGDSGILRIL
jgi:hypothetical protein